MSERHVAPAAADVGEQFEKREVMLDVPDEMGKEYEEGDQSSEPDPRFEEHGAVLGQQQTRDHAGCEEDDAIFVLKGYTCDEAEPQPQFLVARLDDPDQDQRASRPGQRFEGVHRDVVVHREGYASDNYGQCCERLGKSLSAEFAGDPSGKNHSARTGECSGGADGLQGVAEEQPRGSYDDRDERRLVDVAPGQVPAARNEEKLVAEISVEARGIQMDRELGEGDIEDDGRPGGEASPEWNSGCRLFSDFCCFGDELGHSVSTDNDISCHWNRNS